MSLKDCRRVLAANPWFEVAGCWTVVGHADVATVTERLGGDSAAIVGRHVDESAGERPRFFLHPAGDAVALLEMNGWQGSRDAVLRRLSVGTEAYSAYWNVENDNRFGYCRDGSMISWFEGDAPHERYGREPDVLEKERRPLWRDKTVWKAAMLALVEKRTGVAFDPAWLTGTQPALDVPQLPDLEPEPPADLSQEVFQRCGRATEVQRDAAMAWLLDRIAEHLDLRDPITRTAVEAVRAGRVLDEAQRGQVIALRDRFRYDGPTNENMMASPDWRRQQVGWAYVAAAANPWRGSTWWHDVIVHAANALGEDEAWPDTAYHLLTML